MRWSQAFARPRARQRLLELVVHGHRLGFLGAPTASELKRSMVLPFTVLIRTRAIFGADLACLDFAVKSGSWCIEIGMRARTAESCSASGPARTTVKPRSIITQATMTRRLNWPWGTRFGTS